MAEMENKKSMKLKFSYYIILLNVWKEYAQNT